MNKKDKCKGVVVPMVSPFTEDGGIDSVSAARVAGFLIDHGCIPFVLGTTGEAASIPLNQKRHLTECVIESADGRVPVYAGISAFSLEESLQLAADFTAAGADYLVAHLPCYYPLSPFQMQEYFLRLADSLQKPLVIYNIPATTHLSIPVDVVFRLSEHPNIIGIKDSERDAGRLEEIITFCSGNDFGHMCGWGSQMLNSLTLGSDGLVPSTGNVVPGLYRRLYDAAGSGDRETGASLQETTDAISAVYQKDRLLGESLAALKVMMKEMGLCGSSVLSPLTSLSIEDELQISGELKKLDVLNQTEKVTGKGRGSENE